MSWSWTALAASATSFWTLLFFFLFNLVLFFLLFHNFRLLFFDFDNGFFLFFLFFYYKSRKEDRESVRLLHDCNKIPGTSSWGKATGISCCASLTRLTASSISFWAASLDFVCCTGLIIDWVEWWTLKKINRSKYFDSNDFYSYILDNTYLIMHSPNCLLLSFKAGTTDSCSTNSIIAYLFSSPCLVQNRKYLTSPADEKKSITCLAVR